MTTPSLFIPIHSIKSDPALQPGDRGERKLLVTELYTTTEKQAEDIVWHPPATHKKCSVQVMGDTEIAVFNQHASQDRHYHKQGTEIYEVIEGIMKIFVEGDEYVLDPGDMMVVNPGAVHEVKPENTLFICRVVTVNCKGAQDKYIVI
ncbi:MAG: cupin domain-containing protein [SAR324 cluster bacterium]|nr:cupin domain-containing protein [SAR324 cluster bacterium]